MSRLAGLPPLNHPWLITQAWTGMVGLLVTTAALVVRAQEQPGHEGEPGPRGEGGEHCGDDPADEDAGQDADRERGQRPGGERHPEQVEEGGYSGPLLSPAAKIGWTYQETSTLNAPAATATAIASGTTLATVHRVRPKP